MTVLTTLFTYVFRFLVTSSFNACSECIKSMNVNKNSNCMSIHSQYLTEHIWMKGKVKDSYVDTRWWRMDTFFPHPLCCWELYVTHLSSKIRHIWMKGKVKDSYVDTRWWRMDTFFPHPLCCWELYVTHLSSKIRHIYLIQSAIRLIPNLGLLCRSWRDHLINVASIAPGCSSEK